MKAYENKEACKACGLCIDACPKQAIRIAPGQLNCSGYPYTQVDRARCIGCGICYIVCPDNVYRVTSEAEDGKGDTHE